MQGLNRHPDNPEGWDVAGGWGEAQEGGVIWTLTTDSCCRVAEVNSMLWASLVAQMGKDLPAMQEIQVQSLGQEHPLEKEMATHSSILAWRIPWTQEPGGLQSMGSQGVRHD